MYGVTVIGGGASGLLAAITAKKHAPDCRVLLVEKNDRVAKKLAVTGNGQCNITNSRFDRDCYHGDSALAEALISDFPPEAQLKAFSEMGLPIVFKADGRAYPMSLQATSAVDALRFSADEAGVETVCGFCVEKIARKPFGFELFSDDGRSVSSKTLILACGGEAGGKLGSRSGYELLASLGHKITPVHPAIVQLRSSDDYLKALKGIKVTARLTANWDGGKKTGEVGDLLFCDYGISGPTVLFLSSYYRGGRHFTVTADLLPELTERELEAVLEQKISSCPKRPSGELLSGILQSRLAATLLRLVGISTALPMSELNASDIKKTVSRVKKFEISINGTRELRDAQVTSGGADTAEFTDRLMSKRVSGLFACGELLNVDGNCGGFNLSFAWASGRAAGAAAAELAREVAVK